MKKFLSLILLISPVILNAQELTTPPDGGNKKASVSEIIGITDVRIDYDRPALKGRAGKIWGNLVHYGFIDQGFGPSKSAPWRAGANENTTISFSTDVYVEGRKIPSGKYALFMAMAPTSATIILSKNSASWGSYFYDEKEDALRVNVATIRTRDTTERLTYDFSEQTDSSAVISLRWENLRIPFKVSVDLVNTQLESFKNELRSDIGFKSDAWVQAINFAVANKTNLEEALVWSNYAINGVFVGQKNFKTFSAKASVLNALGRKDEADQVMKEALPLANMQELHTYGRQLLSNKRYSEALEIFKLNAQKHPGIFTTNMGLARGYSANGDFKNALKYTKAALPQAPDKNNKDAIENYIKILSEGKDINQ